MRFARDCCCRNQQREEIICENDSPVLSRIEDLFSVGAKSARKYKQPTAGVVRGVAVELHPEMRLRRLASLERALEQLQQALNVKTDLSTKQVRAFLMISKASIEGDPLTTEDLRRFLNLSSQTAHNTICLFVAQDLVVRQAAVFDGRAKHLQLTDAGRSVAHRMACAAQPPITAFAEAFRADHEETEEMSIGVHVND